jgi:hypothetical protein
VKHELHHLREGGGRPLTPVHDARATPPGNTWIFFGGCSGGKNFNLCLNNLVGVIARAKEQMLSYQLFDEKRFDQIISSFQLWNRQSDAALWYAVSWAEGVRDR